MKSKSLLFLITGFAIGAVAGVLFAPQKTLKKRKGPVKKSGKTKKAFKETAAKYKNKLNSMEDDAKARATKTAKAKNNTPGEA